MLFHRSITVYALTAAAAVALLALPACEREEEWGCELRGIFRNVDPYDRNSDCVCDERNGWEPMGHNRELCLQKDPVRALRDRPLGVTAYFLITERVIPTFFTDTLFFFPHVRYDTLRDGVVFPRAIGASTHSRGLVNPRVVEQFDVCLQTERSPLVRSNNDSGQFGVRLDDVPDATMPPGSRVTILSEYNDLDLDCGPREQGWAVDVTFGEGGIAEGYFWYRIVHNPPGEAPTFELRDDTIHFRIQPIPPDW